jgi:chaperonin GroES
MDNLKKFKPVGEHMVLKPKTSAEMSAGGIYIPESARGGLTQGTVIKKGDGVNDYDIGDEIIFQQHSETRIEMDGEMVIILHQNNVILVAKADSAGSDRT